ncbi:MAG: UvrD-helicase domain-containing protein, partial [Verrucomicrobiia bacterium]
FYRKRRQYYGKYYGFVDIIFALVRFFEENNDRIPTYDQVLVDEFQDFNKLEVSLIELLAEKSPVLIVGDDDQALYDFKDASPDHIRRRYTSRSSGYASFELPYCSRCTRVIVKAANDIIASATANGCFKTRIKKKFEYFDHKRKDRESDKNPKIIHASLFAAQIPWFIQQRIEEIAQDVRDKFSVLIISPTKTQSRHIVAALREKGFKNITTVERGDQQEPSLLDGLEILLDDKTSNLGWRIAAKFVLDQEAFESMLQETNDDSGKTVSEIIGSAPKKKIKAMLKILRALRNDEGVDEQELLALTKAVGIEPLRMARDALRDRVQSSSERIGNPGIRKIPIRATTIESSKGLTDEYVFITHFDDLYFIKDNDKGNVTDRDVCKFLVALTRARKKVFLISSDVKNEPTFLTWIDNNRIERIKVVDS